LKPLTVKSRVGADGVLSVAIPMGQAEANREVLVVVQPAAAAAAMGPEAWQKFVREHAGAIADPTFTRQEQGAYEEREPLG
jgi:hypothetical protein